MRSVQTVAGGGTPPPQPLRRSRQRGFTLLEVLFSIVLFALVLILFAATFPRTIHSSGGSANYLQASLLARHKIDQLRQAGYNHLNATDMKQLSMIDSTTANADGSYSFTTTDHLVTSGTAVGYFGAAANAQGTILIGQALTGQGASAPNTRWAKQVTITITWSGSGIPAGSFTTHTIIASP